MHGVQNLEKEVEIPRSVPGLVTRRLLVMNFLDGEQITRLKARVRGMSEAMRRRAQTLILHRVADAYGQMILGSGLFQADPHGGNIMVMKGGGRSSDIHVSSGCDSVPEGAHCNL